MKKKNIIIAVLTLIVVIAFIAVSSLRYKSSDIVSIEYSISSSYGTMADTATRYVKFTPDGKVLLSNSYDSSTDSFNIKKEEYDDLANYINKRISEFDKKAKEDLDVMDGNKSRITIKFKNGKNKSLGGYMVSNKTYNEMVEKINALIDNDTYRNYSHNIGK